jgi:hypothetical protein
MLCAQTDEANPSALATIVLEVSGEDRIVLQI